MCIRDSIKKAHAKVKLLKEKNRQMMGSLGRKSTVAELVDETLNAGTAMTVKWAVTKLVHRVEQKPETRSDAAKSLQNILFDHLSTGDLLPYIPEIFIKKAEELVGAEIKAGAASGHAQPSGSGGDAAPPEVAEATPEGGEAEVDGEGQALGAEATAG
eukprot:9918132-Alexandrium_andersonii.AAC.1